MWSGEYGASNLNLDVAVSLRVSWIVSVRTIDVQESVRAEIFVT